MYRYQVKPGHESKIFAGDNVRNLPGGIVESDHELNSPLLTLKQDQPAAPAAGQLPAAPPAPQLPPAPAPAGLPAAAQQINPGGN